MVLAGAGMGVDSGLPDFRGTEGLWRAYPKLAHLKLRFEDAANPGLFSSNPELAWHFYGHRQALYRATRPHRGFGLLREWGAAKPHGCFVYTSNVDGQFQAAGFSAEEIVECHGNIHRLQCHGGCSGELWQDETDGKPDQASFVLRHCPRCGALARPNVLMFGDWDWLSTETDEQFARFHDWIGQVRRSEARVCLVELGAGSALPAVRHTSETLQRNLDAMLVRINLREAEGPPGTISLQCGAMEALELIAKALSSGQGTAA